MDAHKLINTIQDRLRSRIEFLEIVSGKQSTAEFVFNGRTYFAVGGEGIKVLEMVQAYEAYPTLQSKYLQGMLNGGKRDAAGTLIEPISL